MNPTCKQCGKVEVEDARTHYETPVCFTCLPPPRLLNTVWSLPPTWMVDAAKLLGHVPHFDGAPKRLTPDVLLGLVRDLRDDRDYCRQRAESAHYDRDYWRQRAEAAEYALAPYLDKIPVDPNAEAFRQRPDQER